MRILTVGVLFYDTVRMQMNSFTLFYLFSTHRVCVCVYVCMLMIGW